jgi:uncharacterized protein YuzE
MKGFYDSDLGDVLEIHLTDPIRGGCSEDLEGVDDMCWVEVDDDGEKVGVEIQNPRKYIHLLDVAAEQYDLDVRALKATAAAAMAAPMLLVTVEVEEEAEEELLAA